MVFLNLSSGQGSSGRRRPSRAGSLKLTFPPWAMAFVVGEQTSGIQSRSLRTETRHLEI